MLTESLRPTEFGLPEWIKTSKVRLVFSYEVSDLLQMTLCCIALSTVQLTIRYFRLILMTLLCSWTSDNLVEFRVQKCKYMIISHKKQLQPPPNDVRVNGLSLERVHEYKYLGVWASKCLRVITTP